MRERLARFFRHLLIYGLGDGATAIAALLLLPILTRHLTPSDYGVLNLLVIVELVARVAGRWGLDMAFMRLYVDAGDDAGRRRLASTIFFFLLAANGALVAGGLVAAGWIGTHLFASPQTASLVVLVLVNVFASSTFVIPIQVLRIQEQSSRFVALNVARLITTIVARILLVVWGGMGVAGVVIADLAVTGVLGLVLLPSFVSLIRPVFSRSLLTDALRFGLPRLVHGFAQLVLSLADRYILKVYGTLADVGLYSIGANFSLAIGMALTAFESAWLPFALSVMRDPDAKRTYALLSTYIVAGLVLLVAGVCALADDAVRLFTTPEFHAASKVTPWIALGVLGNGLYIAGSIGLVITKRTKAYPIATGGAAALSVIANLVLVPRFGMMGAAWAATSAYALLAIVATAFARRVYPIPYEWRRLACIGAAGVAAWFVASSVVPSSIHPVSGLLLRGVVTVVVYAATLWLTGFVREDERREIRRLAGRLGWTAA